LDGVVVGAAVLLGCVRHAAHDRDHTRQAADHGRKEEQREQQERIAATRRGTGDDNDK